MEPNEPIAANDHGSLRAARMPREQRKKLLIRHALHHFASKGFHATSMQDIATSAGVTKPVIYQHFSSKRTLYLELLHQVGDDLCCRIRDATEHCDSVHQRVYAGYDSYFRFAHESRSGYELLFVAGPRRDPEFELAIFRVENEVSELVTSNIEADISESHRSFLALGVIALAEGTVRRWLKEVDAAGRANVDYLETSGPTWSKRVAELAWAGLRGISRDDSEPKVDGQSQNAAFSDHF